MASFPWNIRELHCYPVFFAALENSHLVRSFSRLAPPENTKVAKLRRGDALIRVAEWARTRDLRRDRPEVGVCELSVSVSCVKYWAPDVSVLWDIQHARC